MQIETTIRDGVSVTAISGRMDATTVSQFSEECKKLLESGAGRFIIDLGGLEYISSAGLRGILTMGKACRAKGAALAFCSMQSMVADMFKLSGFTSILNVFPTLEDALAGLR
ncbi:MAG: STAS domain-containing protein [Desulfovibrio sp.]|jgi:anti-anti-sigma factor